MTESQTDTSIDFKGRYSWALANQYTLKSTMSPFLTHGVVVAVLIAVAVAAAAAAIAD